MYPPPQMTWMYPPPPSYYRQPRLDSYAEAQMEQLLFEKSALAASLSGMPVKRPSTVSKET